jgi:hypothetical protein
VELMEGANRYRPSPPSPQSNQTLTLRRAGNSGGAGGGGQPLPDHLQPLLNLTRLSLKGGQDSLVELVEGTNRYQTISNLSSI